MELVQNGNTPEESLFARKDPIDPVSCISDEPGYPRRCRTVILIVDIAEYVWKEFGAFLAALLTRGLHRFSKVHYSTLRATVQSIPVNCDLVLPDYSTLKRRVHPYLRLY